MSPGSLALGTAQFSKCSGLTFYSTGIYAFYGVLPSPPVTCQVSILGSKNGRGPLPKLWKSLASLKSKTEKSSTKEKKGKEVWYDQETRLFKPHETTNKVYRQTIWSINIATTLFMITVCKMVVKLKLCLTFRPSS